MIYLLALIPATVLVIAGYFVLYLSHRSEGAFQRSGKYLGFWAFTLAGLVILGALFAAAHSWGGHMRGMHGMYGPMHGMTYGHRQERRFFDAPDAGPRRPNPTDSAPASGSAPAATPAPPNAASSTR